MSVEERGTNEDLLDATSSAELPPSPAAELPELPDAASEAESIKPEPDAAEQPEAVNGAGSAPDSPPSAEAAQENQVAVDTAASSPADEAAAPEQSETVEAQAVAAAEPVADAADTAATSPAEEAAAPVQSETVEAQAVAAAEPVADAADTAATSPAEEAAAPAQSETVEVQAVAAAEPVADAATPPADSADTAVADEASAEQAKTAEAAPPAKEEAKYKRGRVYQGVISKTTPTAVYIDLGDGDQGLVPGRELELMTRKMLESLTVGAEVDVYVVNPRNHRGETILSINHALEELDWRNARKFSKSKEVYEAQIGGYNKGGLIVRFGRLRGFVPQSQLSEDRVRGMSGETPEERYGPMVNQPIGLKVMEVDRQRNRLILSERAAQRDVRQRRKEDLISELKIGEIRKGTVVSLENFGAFVDIGGGEGLIHLSELAWGHITHPRQAVSIGDEVEVEVISVDLEAKRIGLSRRRIIRDPWDEVATSLRRGQLVRGRVTKLTKFGAFARLIDNDAVEGLIHISELSPQRVTHPSEVVKRGDELVLRIVKIDIRERRLGLSLKSVNSTEYLDLDWEMALQDSASTAPESPAPETAEAQSESSAPETAEAAEAQSESQIDD